MIQNMHNVNLLMQDYGCVDGTIIGTGRSDYTTDSTTYNLIVKDKKFALIDIPGIEGDESAFETIIKRSLERAHIIFYVRRKDLWFNVGNLELLCRIFVT